MRSIRRILIGLLFAGGLAHAQGKPPAAPAAPARLVVLHDEELLPSEVRALAELEKKINGKGGKRIVVSDGGPAEKALAAAWLGAQAPASPPPLPEAWKGADAVIVVQVLPPQGKKPAGVSNGVGARLVLRAGEAAPFFVERVDGKDGIGLYESFATWIEGALRVARTKEAR